MEYSPECAVAEMVNKKPCVLKTGGVELKNIHLPSGKSNRVYTFDVSKAEAIFYQLVADKLIKFPQGHSLPKPEELKGKEYCKYYNSWSHTTNNYIVFRNDIHDKIERGEFKFEAKEN